MKSETTTVKALPADPTPDSGPLHRGGPLAFVTAISCALLTLGLVLALFKDGLTSTAFVCMGLFILGLLLVVWRFVTLLKHQGQLPRSHSVLADHLGFRIDFTCHDVAMAAFLYPDELSAGSDAKLLCFVENYSSRQRIADFIIGPHPKLGLQEARKLCLHLAAGQAAVHLLPLKIASDMAPGTHDLPISLRIRKPTGTGNLLPGAKRHLHNLWSVHYATPFKILEKDASTPAAAANAQALNAQYLSLGSVSEQAPRFEELQSFLGFSGKS